MHTQLISLTVILLRSSIRPRIKDDTVNPGVLASWDSRDAWQETFLKYEQGAANVWRGCRNCSLPPLLGTGQKRHTESKKHHLRSRKNSLFVLFNLLHSFMSCCSEHLQGCEWNFHARALIGDQGLSFIYFKPKFCLISCLIRFPSVHFPWEHAEAKREKEIEGQYGDIRCCYHHLLLTFSTQEAWNYWVNVK